MFARTRSAHLVRKSPRRVDLDSLVDSTGTTDKYCGIFSWILGVLCCWCVVCCPCDSRQVYNAPDGKKVLASGTPSGQFVEMC